jgi:hypothetical protein
MLLIDGVRYRLRTPDDEEKEFHPMVKEHSKEIFGESSLYFDVKHVLKSRSGIGSIPDAYVITLSKPYQWYIVENELATHRVYEHVVPQVTRFISGIENLSSEREIRDALYKQINENKVLKTYVEKLVEPEEVHAFLSTLMSRPPKIVIVIDQVTAEINEAVAALKRLGDTDVVEFKTFVRENGVKAHAHVFDPLSASAGIRGPTGELRERKPLPEHYQSWERMLAWVNPTIREIAMLLKDEIISTGLFDVITPAARGRHYCFFRGSPGAKSIFAVFLLTKSALKIRIRTDPAAFKDPENWTRGKIYKGWFFKQGQEKEFTITRPDQLAYAMQLIRQSYELTTSLPNPGHQKLDHDKLLEVYSPIHAMIIRINREIPREHALRLTVGAWVNASLIDVDNISTIFNEYSHVLGDRNLEMWLKIEDEIKRVKGFWLGQDRQKWFDELEAEYSRLTDALELRKRRNLRRSG